MGTRPRQSEAADAVGVNTTVPAGVSTRWAGVRVRVRATALSAEAAAVASVQVTSFDSAESGAASASASATAAASASAVERKGADSHPNEIAGTPLHYARTASVRFSVGPLLLR
jgi:hypothetical protein